MAKRLLFSLVATAVVVSAFILITCTLPSNPYDDPTNFVMKIAAKDTSTIYTGKKAVIRLDINIPKLLKSLKVDFGEGTKDTAFDYTNQSFNDSDVVYLTSIYDTAGQKSITAFANLTNGTTKQFYGTITVVAATIHTDDQASFAITVFSKANKTIIEGKSAEIGLAVNLPKYLKNIKINFGETGIKDTTITYTKQNLTSPDTIYIPCTYTINGKKTVTINTTLTGLTGDLQKSFDISLNVAARGLSIVFDTIPGVETIAVNALDSLRFIAHTEPGDSLISYSVTSSPVINDTTQLKVKALNKTTGSAAVVYITPSDRGKYTITLKAQSGGVIDSQKVVVYAFKAPEFSKKPADSTGLIIGKSDTLVFAVNKEPNDTVWFELKNQSDFKVGTVVVLSSLADTMKIVFTPDEAKKYAFIVAATGKHFSTIIQVIRNVLSDPSSFWKQSVIIVNAVEGTLLQTDLKANFNDTTVSGMAYTTDKGEMSGNALKYTVPSGKTTDTINVTAQFKGVSSKLQVIIQISAETPFWKQLSATISGVEGALLQQNIAAFLTDSTITGVTYTSTKGQISGRSLNYTALWGKTADTLNITANRTGKSPALIGMILQITSGDSSKPSVVRKTPSSDDYKSSTSQITCEYTITDEGAGIGCVVFSIGDSVLTDTTHTGNAYGFTIKNLVKGQNATVNVVVKDASIKKNSTSASVNITYDPTMTDNVGPTITFITKDSLHTSSSSPSVSLTCIDSSGVASVACLYGTHASTATKNTDGTYTANLSELSKGENVIIFTAIDASSNANNTKDTIRIIYDPTMEDVDQPIVNLKSPANADQKVEADTITVKIACHDDNGIGSVTATRGGQAASVTIENDSTYSVKMINLTEGKSDTLNFTVIDKSTKANSKPFSVIIRYIKAPAISVQPVSQTVCAGSPATFSVTATGTAPLSYQWLKGASNINGATNSSYTPSTASAGQTILSCVVSNGASTNATSNLCTLTVNAPPTITSSTNQTTCFGTNATLSVLAPGATGFQWYKGTPGSGTSLSGATTASYATSTAGSYYCEVTGSGCSATSGAATVTVNAPPTITSPTNQTTCSGTNATLSVLAPGATGFQWYKGTPGSGTSLPGATTASYATSTAGSYYCEVTGSGCSATSGAATVTVNAPPTITGPTNQTTCSGTNATLSVSAPGATGFLWYKGTPGSGTSLPGATTASYATSTAGSYYCEVTGSGCSATSGAATVTVNAPPTITGPTPTPVCVGGTAIMSVTPASGTGLQWQWYKGSRGSGGPVSGAGYSNQTTANLTISGQAASSSSYYYCVVSNSGCSDTSNAALLTVNSYPTIYDPTPSQQSSCEGETVNFSVTATGGSLQWYKDNGGSGIKLSEGNNYKNVTSSMLQITCQSGASEGSYYCVVTNSSGCSQHSSLATLSQIYPPITVIYDPGSSTGSAGSMYTVSLSATPGTGTLTFEWYGDGRQLTSGIDYNYFPTVGEKSIMITASDLQTVGSHTFYCVLHDDHCSKITGSGNMTLN